MGTAEFEQSVIALQSKDTPEGFALYTPSPARRRRCEHHSTGPRGHGHARIELRLRDPSPSSAGRYGRAMARFQMPFSGRASRVCGRVPPAPSLRWRALRRDSLHSDRRASSLGVGPVSVRPGQVRYVTRPKSEAMRVTRQLRLPPRYRRVCIKLLSNRSMCREQRSLPGPSK